MLFYVLAAIAAALAVFLWYSQAAPTAKEPVSPEPAPPPSFSSRMTAAIGDAAADLQTVMDHPELGGPGFLLVQFPPQSPEGSVTVTAQYPNIREALYRRIVRQELDPAALVEAGVPEALFFMHPAFETESGGVVLLTLEIQGLPPELSRALGCRRERGALLDGLAAQLRERFPALSVRVFGADLLLSPERTESLSC